MPNPVQSKLSVITSSDLLESAPAGATALIVAEAQFSDRRVSARRVALAWVTGLRNDAAMLLPRPPAGHCATEQSGCHPQQGCRWHAMSEVRSALQYAVDRADAAAQHRTLLGFV
jgi:hypothetical protein